MVNLTMTTDPLDLLFSDLDAECIIVLPEKSSPITGKGSVYSYRPLTYKNRETVTDFAFTHPILHVPGGVRFKETHSYVMFVLPVNDKNISGLIIKYEECFKACNKYVPSTHQINSPLILDESGTAYNLFVKFNKNTTITDKTGHRVAWESLTDKELWLKPLIQWQSIPLNTTKSLQLNLVSAEIVDYKPKEKKNITNIKVIQHNQTNIDGLQGKIEALVGNK